MDKVECKLYDKIAQGGTLKEEDYKFLSEVVKEALSFMAKEKIIPSPQNYDRWFRIFCYAKEKGLNLSKHELIDLYIDTYQTKIDKEQVKQVDFVDRITEELFESIQRVLKQVSEHDKGISKGGEKLEEMVSLVPAEDIQIVLKKIMNEVRGLKNINRAFIKKLEEQKEEISKLREELRKVKEEASIDPLTGLRNRRSFERTLWEFFKDFNKYGYPFSVIMMDLDNFKQINDTHGHLAGDRVLREVGNILRNYLRAKDVPARTGGEEFAIVLPGISKDEAVQVAERIRRVLENHMVEHDGEKIKVTASFGVSQMEEGVEKPEDLLKDADEKLYKAKREGKNRVVS